MVTCWERADLLALVSDVLYVFVTFPCGILGQMLHLIVSIPDICPLSNLDRLVSTGTPDLEVIKSCSCLTQLNMNFILVMHIKMTTSVDI